MSHAGVVYVLEGAVLDQNIIALRPNFKGVSEADLQLLAPSTSADVFDDAIADCNMVSAACQAVNAAIHKVEIFKAHSVAETDQLSCVVADGFDMRINGCRVADRVDIERLFVERGLESVAEVVSVIIKIALCAKLLLSQRKVAVQSASL